MILRKAARLDNDSESWARWGFAVCCLVSLLRLPLAGLWAVVGGAALLIFVFQRFGRSGTWRAFGCMAPLLPIAGDGVLLSVGLYVLALVGRAPLVPEWSRPFVLIVIAHLLAGIVVDGVALGDIWVTEGGSSVSLTSWLASSSYGVTALGPTLRLLLLIGLFSSLTGDRRSRWDVLEGIGWGAVVAGIGIGVMLLFPGLVHLPNDTELWRHLRRHAGTFTDPNAFGVAAMLLIVILLDRGAEQGSRLKQRMWYGVALAWLCLGSASGSRTFFLGLGAMTMVWLFLRSRRLFTMLLLGGILALGVAQRIDPSPYGLPIGLERVLDSLRWERVGETFHSRTVFWSIGGAVFADHPWFGVGLGSFWRFVEPYSQALAIPLGTWTDNANSYYLGILAELGLIGGVAWVLSIRSLSLREPLRAGGWATTGIVAFLVMCVVGPHLDFDEVTVLFAVLFAGAVIVRERGVLEGRAFRYPTIVVAVILIVTISTQRLEGEWGLYPYERDEIGRFRWSGPRARIEVPCARGEALLVIRAVHPDIARTPVQIQARTSLEEREVVLRSVESKSIALRCQPDGAPGLAASDRIGVQLSVTPPLVPALAFGGEDRRSLGVQVRAQP